jgi:hypothetical protein
MTEEGVEKLQPAFFYVVAGFGVSAVRPIR